MPKIVNVPVAMFSASCLVADELQVRDLLIDGITAFDGALNVNFVEFDTSLVLSRHIHSLLCDYAPESLPFTVPGGEDHHVSLSPGPIMVKRVLRCGCTWRCVTLQQNAF